VKYFFSVSVSESALCATFLVMRFLVWLKKKALEFHNEAVPRALEIGAVTPTGRGLPYQSSMEFARP
jgi:hypothetical protein